MANKPKKSILDTLSFDDLDTEFDPGTYLAELTETGLSDNIMSSSVFKDEKYDVPRAANFMEFCQSPAYLNFLHFHVCYRSDLIY